MKVGIIAEGKADLAVITNILKGSVDIDKKSLDYIQPEYYLDETDLNNPSYKMTQAQFSNWELVLKECIEKTKIIEFFDNPLDEDKILIIQIDTAESELPNYNVKKPTKKGNQNYVEEIRIAVANKLDSLIGTTTYKIIYAICVEETDAWILTIYPKSHLDTGFLNDPKKELDNQISKDKKLSKIELAFQNKEIDMYEKYYELSKDFRKKNKLKNFMIKNKSLELFCNELGI